MNKTVSINLGGIFFHIEEDAYTKMDSYLDSINRHFSNEEGAEEILEDIEARIAEMFQETLVQSKRQVILPSDVAQVIGIMGLPDQFGEPEIGGTQAHVNQKTHQETHAGNPMADMPKGERASNRKKSRRLYRNPDEAFMGGVCAGLSDYFGIEDPLWVRMAFAFSFFTGGWGLLPYILLWAIVPEAKTPAQKLAMRGEPINVSNIEKIVKEGMDNLKSTIEDFSKGENGQKT
ncbi:MAG: PspC domain-containing protein, partial [Chitinophagales bacterium]